MLVEAEELADIRLIVRDRLLAEVIVQLKEWKAVNYHKQMVGSCKEAKVFEDDFHKVFGQIYVQNLCAFSTYTTYNTPMGSRKSHFSYT